MSDPKRAATNQELKEVLKAVADTETLVSELSNGFSFQELGALIAVGQDVPPIIKDSAVLLPEWEALDDAGRADLVAYVQDNCKFPASVTVESFTQKLLTAAVLLSQIYQVIVTPPVQPL